MIELPGAFVARIREQMGTESDALLDALSCTPLRGIRLHPQKAAGKVYPDAGAKVLWEPDGWELRIDSLAGTGVLHEAGAFYLQEPSAMIPAAVLDPRPGEWVLDLCAAPGGKSTQMGLRMAGEGVLVCNEPVEKRARILSRNVERMGIPHALVTCAMPEDLAKRWPEFFDAVMVDAPCSGEGMFRRDAGAREEWSEAMAAGCAKRQIDILKTAARLVRPGGRMVYSTCTWNPAENEENVKRFLTEESAFELEAFSLPGVNGSLGCFTCFPHRTRGEGQFVARFRRTGAGGGFRTTEAPFQKPDRETGRMLNILFGALQGQIYQRGTVIGTLRECPPLAGLKVLRAGLHLAELRGTVLRPDHAAAIGASWEKVESISLDAEEALGYLAGESLPGDVRGWLTVNYLGLPLGWAKGSDGQLKNHYPKGLRNHLLAADTWRAF